MPSCKNCKSEKVVKSGFIRGKQRYQCKNCGCNFVEGDSRTNEKTALKKAMCILLYSLGKVSYSELARIFDTWPSQVYRWITESGAKPPDESTPGSIKQMDFEEMWFYIRSKREEFGPSTPLVIADGELWPGFSAVLILNPSNGSGIKHTS